MLRSIILGATLVVAVAWALPFSANSNWEDCGTNEDRSLLLQYFSVEPNPVVIPGDITVNMLAQNRRRIDRMGLDLLIERHIWNDFYFTIPCVNRVGSCEYHDLCDLLSNPPSHARDSVEKAQDIFRQAGHNLTCPFEPKVLDIRNVKQTLPEMPDFITMVAVGKYRITAKFTEHETGQELGCYRITVEAEAKEKEETDSSCFFFC